MKAVVIGGISYDDIIHVNDFFDDTPQTVFAKSSYSTPGSTGLGKAIALKRLNFETTIIGAIGVDFYGEEIRQLLRKEEIVFYPLASNVGTERHVNIMNAEGNRISVFLNSVDNIDIDVEKYAEIIRDCDIVCLNIKNYCRKFIPLLKKYKKTVWVDLHDYDGYSDYYDDFIAIADFIFMSSDRLENPQVYMKKFLNENKLSVCTKGNEGAIYLNKDGQFIAMSADSLEIVDTNGAGDNFFAGFIYGHYHGQTPQICLEYGKLAANSCILSRKIVSDDLSEATIMKKPQKNS